MRWFNGLIIAGLAAATLPVNAAATKARLVLPVETARPGATVLAGVRFEMDPGWHIYWRNPGESGLATSIQWTLPRGLQAGDIQWPPPELHTAADLTTYVYHDEVVLLVPLRVAADAPPGEIQIKAKVSWLECKEECVTGSTEVQAGLVVGPETRSAADAALLEQWQKRIPPDGAELRVHASWGPNADAAADTRTLLIEGQGRDGFTPNDFLPYASDAFEVRPAAKVLSAGAGLFRLEKSVKRLAKAFPASVPGLLIRHARGSTPAAAYEVKLSPGGTGSTPGGASSGAPPKALGQVPVSLWKMLGLAFLGGLILNIMPCVLPVIALKILGFVQQSKESPRRVRRLGLLYGAGVLASFLALAGMVLAVQRAGGAASWGMQMQNPFFRLTLTVLVALVALNLFGVFEVTLGGGLLGAAGQLAYREGGVGAFFNGVLATALATPCTAPFLTVALGFAFTQHSAAVVVLMFTASALGLAAPYVLLSWHPAWLRLLPKPGGWMQQFKVIMGFPMLATAIWLFDVTAPSFGDGGVLWLGLFLVVLALAAWVWGEFVQRGTKRRPLAVAWCILLVGLGYGYALEKELHWRSPAGKAFAAEVVRDTPEGIAWHKWSLEAVQKARAEGHPVLVDFTANWCLTCKANKKLALDVPAVRAKLNDLKAIAFRADNTDPNPAITAELQRYQRAGVPLVLVFPAALEQPPQVLPALLTPSLVLEALDAAAK